MIETVAPESVGIPSERLAAIDAAMQAFIHQGKYAGISALIACKGKVIHFGCYGKLDISRDVPILPQVSCYWLKWWNVISSLDIHAAGIQD